MDHPLSRFQTSVARREDFRKISITTVSENIFEFFLHKLMSNILSYVYRKWFRKYYVSNLRMPIVNRRFKTKICQNLLVFECQFHPFKIIGHPFFLQTCISISCIDLIYFKKSKNNFFGTVIQGRKRKNPRIRILLKNLKLITFIRTYYRHTKRKKYANIQKIRENILKSLK